MIVSPFSPPDFNADPPYSEIPHYVISFNNRQGDVTLTALDVEEALGYTPTSGTVTVTIADVSGLQTALDSKQPVGSYLTSTDLTWTNISGKPTTFPPSAHIHAIEDVTGLQDALDGKQPTGAYTTLADLTWANISSKPATFPPSAHTHPISDVVNLQTTLDSKADDSDITTVNTALSGKEPTITAGSTSQYWRGDKSWQTLDKAAVGLSNVDNTSDANKPVSTAQQTALNGKANLVGDNTFSGNITATNLSGTNTGDQTTVTGNAGTATALQTSRNFSITGGGITAAAVGFNGTANVALNASVDAGHITLARMANVATGTVFYRKTTGTGAPEVQTLATLKTDLGLTGTNSGDQTITLTGPVTGSGTGSFATTITDGVITLAKMANVNSGTVFYRKTAAAGVPEVQTLATLKTDLGLTGTNSGDQSSIVGITGTTAQFNTANTDADFYVTGGTDVALADGGTGASLTDPNADRIMFWDDSAGQVTWLSLGTNLSITGTTLDATGGGGLTDGDKGDVVVSGSGGTLTVESAAGNFAAVGEISAPDVKLVPGTAPGVLANGQMWYDTSAGKFKVRQGGVTLDMIGAATLADADYGDVNVSGGAWTVQGATGNFAVTGDATISGGDLVLNNATSNLINFGNGLGRGSPTVTTRSVGTKILLDDTLSGTQVDYAIGLDNDVLWNSVRNSGGVFKWYASTSEMMSLGTTGNGSLTVGPFGAGSVTVGSSAFGSGWNGNQTVPTRDDVYDAAVAMLSSYRTIMDSSGSHTAARVAGTYGMGQGDPLAITGTGTLYPLNIMYIDPNDYPSAGGLSPKMRLRCTLMVNDVAPTGNFTIGLHPVTRPGTSGGTGLDIYTIGAAVAGSTVAVNTPAADSMNNAVGTDFAVPTAGFYVIGVVTTATVAASSHLHLSATLQLRHT